MEDLRNFRVSLKFSEKDGDHIAVVKLLKQLGRKKSNFIVKAVKYYMENNPMPEIPGSNPVITNMVTEAVVKATLLKMIQSGELPVNFQGLIKPEKIKLETPDALKSTEKNETTVEKDLKQKPSKRQHVKIVETEVTEVTNEPSEDDYIDETSKKDADNEKENEAVNSMLSMLDEF